MVVNRKPAKVKSNDSGLTEWADTIEEIELDLMSSQELELALQANDTADTGLSASLRHDEVLPESTDTDCEDELSLASTQDLHQMLSPDDSENLFEVPDDNPGFDPYDKG